MVWLRCHGLESPWLVPCLSFQANPALAEWVREPGILLPHGDAGDWLLSQGCCWPFALWTVAQMLQVNNLLKLWIELYGENVGM